MRAPRALATAVCLLLLAGCARHGKPATAVRKRVVSLSPNTTEAMAAIGALGQLVGRSRYCDYPPEVRSLPEVGGYVDPNTEAILALAPDLVTGARGPAGRSVADRFESRGIDTYFPVTESLAGIDEMIRGLGERTGHAAEADVVARGVDAKVRGVSAALAALPEVRVLLIFGITPIVAAGPGGFPDEMIRRARGKNVVEQGGAYPTLGIEQILALDPDIVIDAAWGEQDGTERIGKDTPGWRELRAVKAGKVVRMTDEVVLRPGPRVGEGLAALAKAIHPEARLP